MISDTTPEERSLYVGLVDSTLPGAGLVQPADLLKVMRRGGTLVTRQASDRISAVGGSLALAKRVQAFVELQAFRIAG